MRAYFEWLALVRYVPLHYKSLIFHSFHFLIFFFCFCQLVREETTIGRMVGKLVDKQCDLLIELGQYKSLGLEHADIEKLKQKAEVSVGLVEMAQEFEES